MTSVYLVAPLLATLNILAVPDLSRAQDPVTTPGVPVPTPAPPHGKAEHVVIVVWDGMRPDLIREDLTPTLAKMAREGTFFARHHSVYPTSTEVNGTAIVTGCFPGHSGIIGNREYRPAINPLRTVAMEEPETLLKGDEITGGKYLAAATLPEILRLAGDHPVIAGTKGVALLLDRHGPQAGEDADRRIMAAMMPTSYPAALMLAQGIFPLLTTSPNTAADTWTTFTLTSVLWGGEPPKLSILWLSEPDFAQHGYGIASPQALAALAGNDAQLATVLDTLNNGGWRDRTDVLVVSDHGFSTIGTPVDVARRLEYAGLPARRQFQTPPKTGDILVNGLGGSAFLYVTGHDEPMVARIVEVLQASNYAGVIFTRRGLPGTFPLEAAHIDSPDAPDVVVALRWSGENNAAGVPGIIVSDGSRLAGQGTHATFSRFDVHNTLVAAGPDFRAGVVNETPSSNADITPTAAWILGVPLPSPVDGRVLREALTSSDGTASALPPSTERLEATREYGGKVWRQYLQVTRYDGETYLDEANGGNTTADKP